jgi:hypothetical protein
VSERVREALLQALRPEDGGVADRRDLGSFAGHAFGVHAEHVTARSTSRVSPSYGGTWLQDVKEETRP